MVNELELIENIEILRNHSVIFYGAGIQGEKMLEELQNRGIVVKFFCDSDVMKWGKSIKEVKVISPAQLKQLDNEEELVIIIMTRSTLAIEQVTGMLDSLAFRTNHIATLYGLEMALQHNKSHGDDTFLEKWDMLEKAYNEREVWRLDHLRNFMTANNILVYQPGKVGSQTISNSLVRAGITKSFFSGHIHTLNYLEMESAVKAAITLKLESLYAAGTIKIITLVREPIIRDLSYIFQVAGRFELETPPFAGSFIDLCSRSLERIALGGDYLFGRPSGQYGFQFEWFDYELKSVFGIDIFAHHFDKVKGYSIIKQGNVEVLVIKLEKLSLLERVIGDFIGVSDFELVNYNESAKRKHKYLYANVLEVIKVPPKVVALYYQNNQRMDHFYDEEEKASFLKEWRIVNGCN